MLTEGVQLSTARMTLRCLSVAPQSALPLRAFSLLFTVSAAL